MPEESRRQPGNRVATLLLLLRWRCRPQAASLELELLSKGPRSVPETNPSPAAPSEVEPAHLGLLARLRPAGPLGLLARSP